MRLLEYNLPIYRTPEFNTLVTLLNRYILYKSVLPVLLAFAIACPLAGQEYIANVQHFGVEQGLSHREVNCIFQDSRGFIWIGTPNGLNRFDGYSFRLYTREKDGLPFNDIRVVSEDADGWLWLIGPALKKTICLFHPDRHEAHPFEEKFGTGYPALSGNNEIGNILRDNDGTLWLSPPSSKTLYRYHPSTGLQAIPIAGIEMCNPIALSQNKTIWATTDLGKTLLEIDLKGRILQRKEHTFLHSQITPNGFLATVLEGSDKGKLALFDASGQVQSFQWLQFSPYPKPNPAFIYPYNDQGIIIVHNSLIDPRRGVLATWEFAQHAENNYLWRTIMKDRDGKLWLGDDFGFYILQIKNNRFKKYLQEKEAINGQNSIRGIQATPEKLYVNLEKFGFYAVDFSNRYKQKLDGPDFLLGHFAMSSGNNGELLSGGARELVRYTPATGATEKIQVPNASVWAVCCDTKGTYWIGTDAKGLFTCDSGMTTARPYTQYNEFEDIAKAIVVQIARDSSGILWACADNGFYKIDPEKGVVARYWSGGKGAYFLPADNFYHFHIDRDQTFWFGTAYGLVRAPSRVDADGARSPAWDTGQGKVYTRAEGLSNDVVYAVYEDDRNKLWLATDHGIIRLDKKTGLSKTFLEADGITDPEFNRTAHFQDKQGTIYFGSLNGITAFQPTNFYELEDSLSKKPLEITLFQQFDGTTNKLADRTSELLQTREITLQPDDRFFNLEFALLSFDEVRQIQYAWKIEGLDKDWHYQKENHFNYGGLPYGSYTIRIKAQAADGQWSAREITLGIRAIRPWYLQAWFLILALIATGSGIYGYIRWRDRNLIFEQKRLEAQVAKATERIEKQAQELRHLDEIKSRFFANVSHELRTPLTLLLGPLGSILHRNKQDPQDATLLQLAQMHGRQLLQLVNQILDLSKLESGKLELQEKPTILYPLLRRIVAAFESHAERKGIQFEFQYKAGQNLRIRLDALKFETILNNLLSNALKFTSEGGTITVIAENLAHSIRVSVYDTGRGIHPDDLPLIFDRFYQSAQPDAPTEGGTGIGLALCSELVALMGGTIRAESAGPGHGSRFFVELPLCEVLGAAGHSDEITAFEPALDMSPVLNQEQPSATSEPGVVLLVEDNDSLRDYVKMILSKKHQVVTASNGQSALDALKENLPDLIVSDIMMPVMDGFQLLERLKQDPAFRQIPVIMLTARADMQDKLRALRIGVDDYLLKPFEEEELMVRIEALLKRSRERRQWLRQSEETAEPELQEPVSDTITAGEAAWLEELEQLVAAEAQNDQLSVTWVADRLHLSERQFQRRLKKLTGLSPNDYLTEVRLQEARRLLEQGLVRSVKELAWKMNFRQEKYFSQIFRERFGKSPSDLMR